MENEELISSVSYTAKDFNSIYVELLDLVKKLTNKWDPSLSNESDPGVVLLKLAAIIGDKNNYNIDKNVLECFPASVTQLGNARKLYDLLGYKMHWYVSALTTVIFKLKSTNVGVDATTLSIPAFTTLYDSTGQLAFTTTQKAILYTTDAENTSLSTVPAIQGTSYQFKVDGNPQITVQNLDEENRLYFSETQIAENGIFVGNYLEDESQVSYNWKKVDNINLTSGGELVFEFGVLPNTNTCYIQFPKDISKIIGQGLSIRYIVSSGVKGNIKANTLETFEEISLGDVVLNDKIRLIQRNATVNGKDPETIDDAYKNYKKTIGTFQTLVTTKDYESWLFNNAPYISNCVVSDRTSDLNATNYLQVWDGKENKELMVLQQDTTDPTVTSPSVTAYNLIFYLLKSVNNNATLITTKDAYDTTFEIEESISVQDTLFKDEGELDEVKCLPHTLKFASNLKSVLQGYDNWFKYMLINLFKIKTQIITYYKVTNDEATEILDNVLTLLYEKYNSREIDFGKEIDYNSLVEDIISADTRIKSITLTPPIYDIRKVDKDKNINKLNDNDKNDLVARMALSGNVNLFTFDNSFNYEFGQQSVTCYGTESNPIKKISSEVTLNVPNTSNNPLILNKNELLQIIEPYYTVDTQYSTYVRYKAVLSAPINENEPRRLGVNESISLSYYDSNNLPQTQTLIAGQIVELNFTISQSMDTYQVLSASEYINVLKLAQSGLTVGTKYCYITNTGTMTLPYILQDGEYFIYTSTDENELVLLGSGTLITSEDGSQLVSNPIDPELVQNKDIENIPWKELPFEITLEQQKITNLGENVQVYATSAISGINNDYLDTRLNTNTLYYKSSTSSEYTAIKETLGNIYIQSRLMLNAGLDTIEELNRNTQTITFTYVDNTTSTITGNSSSPVSLTFNNFISITGGTDIDAIVIQPDGTTKYSLIGYSYIKNNSWTLTRNNGIITLNTQGQTVLPFDFSYSSNSYSGWIIPIIKSAGNNSDTISVTNGKIADLNSFDFTTSSSSISITANDTVAHYIYVEADSSSNPATITLTLGSGSTLVLGYIKRLMGLNTQELNVSVGTSNDEGDTFIYSDQFNIGTSITNVLARMETLYNNCDDVENNPISNKYSYNWVYQVLPEDKVIKPTLSSSYWNNNHLFNKYTIAKIDFDNSNITISPNSLK